MEGIKTNMKTLFAPASVAVIGASDNSEKLGFHVMKSLVSGGFAGPIIAVNPRGGRIMGIEAHPSVQHYPAPIDLAVVVLPAKWVPKVLRECVDKGVRGVVLITAGFKEIDDPRGALLQEQAASLANGAGIPVIGPNTFGMVNLQADLNASFTPEMSRLKKGNVCLVSQSGGIAHVLAFLAMRGENEVGFSKILGLGNRLNVDFAIMVDHLMEDPETEVILLYVEGLDQPGDLLNAAREHRGRKPIVALKSGKSEVGNAASQSHTGSMAGNFEIYTGAFRQAGILCMNSCEALLDAARGFSVCPLPDGPGVAILTGQAGLGLAASDVCDAEGLVLAAFSPHTQERINELLPPLALRTNPVDLGPAWYDTSAIKGIVEAALQDTRVNGILLFMMYASANAGILKGLTELFGQISLRKPIMGCILSPPGIWDEEIRMLEELGRVVNFPTPESAARALAALWTYRQVKDLSG
jgi:acyl-CoA synthetase (NDP forming)